MRVMVTGGAGFIGSHLIDALVERGNDVIVVDNLCSGKLSFIQDHIDAGNVEHINHDLTNLEGMAQYFDGIEMVFHLAANADIRLGTQITDTDLRHGTVATYNVLESMRLAGVNKIVFASSSVVYGENAPMPTPETYGPTIPISLYGASKLAAEGLIGSWVGTFGFQAWVFRFANIIGERGTHGVIFDFINKLNATPNRLEVLGNGLQEKSYMEVKECVSSILHVVDNTNLSFNLCNLGSVDTISVRKIAETVVEETGYHNALIDYTGGDRGWAGDIPRARLAIDKLNQLGYIPSMNSKEAVRHTVRALINEIGLR